MSWQDKLHLEKMGNACETAGKEIKDYFLHLKIYTLVFGLCCLGIAFTSSFPGSTVLDDDKDPVKQALANVPTKDPMSASPWDFFHPVWQKSPTLNFFGSDKSSFETMFESPVDTKTFVKDPAGRIEKEFQVNDSMRTAVSFWVDVYARYSSHIRIVHDRHDLSIIYGYIDFRPFYRIMPRIAAEAKSNQVEKQILKTLKAKILEATVPGKVQTLLPEEKDSIQKFLSANGMGSKEAVLQKVELVRTQSGQSDMFLQALYRSKNLLPHIEAVFKQNGLPVALARIPFVESSFNAKAQSKIGAIGIWQFTRETAKEMIHADEELWADPLRQTKSAARLLKMYKIVLPDWGTVITSYNSGVGRLRRIVEKNRFTKMEQIYTLPPDKDSLGFAGRNFYPEFLAANIVEAYKEEIFSHLLTPKDYSIVFRGKGVFAPDSCEM